MSATRIKEILSIKMDELLDRRSRDQDAKVFLRDLYIEVIHLMKELEKEDKT